MKPASYVPKVTLTRGDVVRVDLSGAIGREKQKTRPCVVVQNNIGNTVSPLTIVVPMTDLDQHKFLPIQVVVRAPQLWGGAKDGVIECGHARSIDRDCRIDESSGVLCHVDAEIMEQVDTALRVSFAL